jgi:hypothetical protein
MAQDQLLKAVRITDDMKLEVYQQGKKRKYGIIYDSSNAYINNRRNNTENTKSEKYDVAMSDDDVIQEFLKRYNNWFYSAEKKYVITQNPYKDPAPVRTYGAGGTASPYYLNNGCAINIQWVGRIPNPEFNPGTYSNLYDAEQAGKPRYLENVTITATSDAANNSNILPKSSWSVSPPITDGSIYEKEVTVDYRDTSYVYSKIVTVTLPNGFTENGGKGYLVWTQGGLQYDSKSIPENTPTQRILVDGQYVDVGYSKPKDQITYFSDSDKDSNIIEKVISDFESKVSSLHGIFRYELKLCAPNNEACSLVPYKSPLEPPNNTKDQLISNDTPLGPSQSIPKIKFTIDGLPDTVVIKAKVSLPEFKIWTGPIPKPKELSDTYDEENSLDPQYLENDYTGSEETGLDLATWKIQDAVSNSQLDSDANGGTVGAPADIKPYSSFDQLIELAGKCARELGKNARVNAENMKKGYTKGIHGLCPQGTQAVLYALTGVKAVGKLSGNADYFSFGPTNPSSSSRSSFANTGYYNDKVKISQVNGSWKGTYLHKDSKSMWQVGDVIAMAYSGGKNYGHIQVWTGFSWMSDFKQGNSIQQNHVNVDSVALWRLNEKGIAAVKKQQGSLA